MDKDLELFLEELTALTKKHNLIIGGCGCCGSPVILRPTKIIAEDLRYHNNERYTIKEPPQDEDDEDS